MNEPESTERSSRRTFLARAGALSGAVAVSGVAGAASGLARRPKKRKAFYKLGPNEPYYHCPPVGGGDCSGCKACHRHAKNKLFPSARAANNHRAHRGCRCGVYRAGTLNREKWFKLFGPRKNRRKQVDKRRLWVRRILASAAIGD